MPQIAHDLLQRRHIIDVLHALAHRFQNDGKGWVLTGNIQKLLGALALLPQRGALAGIAAGQKQRAGRAFAEAGGKKGGIAHLLGYDIGNIVGVEGKNGAIGIGLALGQAQHDAIIAGHRLRVHAGALAHPRAYRQGPGGVDRPAKGRVQHHAPVPQLILEALEHERLFIRNNPGGLLLFAQVGQDIAAGILISIRDNARVRIYLAAVLAQGLAQLIGAPGAIAIPKW